MSANPHVTMSKFSIYRHKLRQLVGGKDHRIQDADFDEASHRYVELLEMSQTVKSHLMAWVTSLRSYMNSSTLYASEWTKFFIADEKSGEKHPHQQVASLNEMGRKDLMMKEIVKLESLLQNGAYKRLQTLTDQYNSFKEDMKAREELLNQYDHYLEKFDELSKKRDRARSTSGVSAQDEERYSRNQKKLDDARLAYEVQNSKVINKLRGAWDRRYTDFDPIFVEVLEAEKFVMASINNTYSRLQPERLSPEQIQFVTPQPMHVSGGNAASGGLQPPPANGTDGSGGSAGSSSPRIPVGAAAHSSTDASGAAAAAAATASAVPTAAVAASTVVNGRSAPPGPAPRPPTHSGTAAMHTANLSSGSGSTATAPAAASYITAIPSAPPRRYSSDDDGEGPPSRAPPTLPAAQSAAAVDTAAGAAAAYTSFAPRIAPAPAGEASGEQIRPYLLPGLLCKGQYGDGEWYPIKIEGIEPNGQFLVSYTEYGNQEVLDINRIRVPASMLAVARPAPPPRGRVAPPPRMGVPPPAGPPAAAAPAAPRAPPPSSKPPRQAPPAVGGKINYAAMGVGAAVPIGGAAAAAAAQPSAAEWESTAVGEADHSEGNPFDDPPGDAQSVAEPEGEVSAAADDDQASGGAGGNAAAVGAGVAVGAAAGFAAFHAKMGAHVAAGKERAAPHLQNAQQKAQQGMQAAQQKAQQGVQSVQQSQQYQNMQAQVQTASKAAQFAQQNPELAKKAMQVAKDNPDAAKRAAALL